MSFGSAPSGSDPAWPVAAQDGLRLEELLRILRRRRRLVLILTAVATLLATALGVLRGEAYTGTALVMIDQQRSAPVEFVPTAAEAPTLDIETQIKFIRSHENLARTVDRLDLYATPSLLFSDSEPEGLASLLPDDWVIAGGVAKQPSEPVERDAAAFRGRAIAALERGLDVSRWGDTNILAISFTAAEPVRAARLADGVAKAYVEGELDRKKAELRQAESWLSDRVEDLRLRVIAAERAIEQYRAANDLFADEHGALDWQQIALLTTQLIDARAERTAKEAELRRVQELVAAGDYDVLADALSSPIIMTLRQEELELLRREAELAQELGPQHPRIQQLQGEKERVTDRIQAQLDNAVRTLENEAAAARSREDAFQHSLDEARELTEKQLATSGQAAVQLRGLEREASAERSLYERFLISLKQTEDRQQIVEPDARVISPAEVPGRPSSLSPMLMAFIGFTGSLALSSIAVVFLDQLDTTLRSGPQVQELLGVRTLGLVPAVAGEHGNLLDYLVAHPDSAYAEAVRALYAQTQLAGGGRAPEIVLVTSALPGEGKTSLAGSLAICAAQLHRRTLLVDLDLRRPTLAQRLGLHIDRGILELVTGDATVEDCLRRHDVSGIDVLAPARSERNPTRILASERLETLLREARDHYDCVIVDGPPVLGIADAKMLARQADAVLFAIAWERTRREAARSALEELRSVSANVIGAVIDDVDMKRHAYYGLGDSGQFYKTYSRYYHD